MKRTGDITPVENISGHMLHIPKLMQFSPQPDITLHELALVLVQLNLTLAESLVLPEIARHFKEQTK